MQKILAKFDGGDFVKYVQYKKLNPKEENTMQKITLKDDCFRVIGYVEIDDNGNKILKDERFWVRGYYDAATDTTKDERRVVVGRGDILTTLLR